jgi:hypothetical protein
MSRHHPVDEVTSISRSYFNWSAGTDGVCQPSDKPPPPVGEAPIEANSLFETLR